MNYLPPRRNQSYFQVRAPNDNLLPDNTGLWVRNHKHFKINVFCDVTSCRVVKFYRCFGVAKCFHLQGKIRLCHLQRPENVRPTVSHTHSFLIILNMEEASLKFRLQMTNERSVMSPGECNLQGKELWYIYTKCMASNRMTRNLQRAVWLPFKCRSLIMTYKRNTLFSLLTHSYCESALCAVTVCETITTHEREFVAKLKAGV